MQVLIIGFGYVGKHLVKEAVSRGYKVWATSRNTENFLEITKAGATPLLFGDPLPEDLTHILVTTPPQDGKDPFLKSYTGKLPKTLEWLGYYSTTGVYGNAQGNWVNEESSLGAQNERALARIACETKYKTTTAPLAIMRLSGIYGDDKNTLQRLKDGKQNLPEEAGPICRIHVDDIVTLTLGLMEQRLTGIFNISDDAPASTRSTVLEACKKLNIDPMTLPQSNNMSKGFGGEGFRKVENQKIKEALQTELKYPSFTDFLKTV
ncbi:MAG: hypothetical protein VX730_04965 [Pseudomonadota bacterium]|nr:hypothetical protein [Pseudomonadota bacterium]